MRRFVALAALAVPLAAAAPAAAQLGDRFTARLAGSQETEPGDSNGTGTATVRFDRRRGRVCFTIAVRSIDRVAMAHIHRGGRGVAGPIVVTLIDSASSARRFSDCAEDVDAGLIRKIMRRPSGYYVNVHTERFPAGAVRGQLVAPRR